MLRKLTFSLICLFGFTSTYSQVLINEYSASNLHGHPDSFEKTEDWIELYNTGKTDMDISGWHLSDKESKPGKWEIPSGTIIPAKGHLIFFCSGRDGKFGEEFHTNFKLTQTKGSDLVLLTDASESVIGMHMLDLTLVEHSHARAQDGSDDWMVCIAPTYGTSNDGAPMVKGYTATPTVNLEAGYYSGQQKITITNNEANSELRITLDGTNPTKDSPLYSDTLLIDQTTVVKARSFSLDSLILPGKMDFNTYFIDEDFTLKVFSVAADSVLDLAGGDGPVIPIGSIEYFNENKEREATSFGSLNRHGQDSWVLDHRSLDWISRDEMGYSKAVLAPIFSSSDRDEYQKFMFRNSGDDNYPAIDDYEHEGSTHIRDEYVQTLGRLGGLKLDNRTVERVILFLNGQYWGVYGMREKVVDHDYTNEYYDQDKYSLQYLATWNDTEIEYGGLKAMADWENLRNFILDEDMSDSDNYKIVDDSLNLTSLIDYFIINMAVVAKDWLNYNTGWWRGMDPEGDHKKWGYILWDLDATFDYYINYTGIPDESPNATPCDIIEISESMDYFFGEDRTNHGNDTATIQCASVDNGSSPYPTTDPTFQLVINYSPRCCDTEWDNQCQQTYDFLVNYDYGSAYFGNVGSHEKILTKLINENAEFKQLYYSRYADLMNTVFSCENMNHLLDSMIATIDPEMDRQIERWGGTRAEWEENVVELKNFINERCAKMASTALECFTELDGPHELTLLTRPDGIGEIDLNTLDIESFPWTGSYFGNMENIIKAKVFDEFEEDYIFSHWESSSANFISPDSSQRKASISLSAVDTLTAVFVDKSTVNTEDLSNKYDLDVFPNPVKEKVFVQFELDKASEVKVELVNLAGQKVWDFNKVDLRQGTGRHQLQLDLNKDILPGLYFLVVHIDQEFKSFKLNIQGER